MLRRAAASERAIPYGCCEWGCGRVPEPDDEGRGTSRALPLPTMRIGIGGLKNGPCGLTIWYLPGPETAL